jgi:hypothetical protein
MAPTRKAIHAYLSPEAHDAWHDFAAENGVSVLQLFENRPEIDSRPIFKGVNYAKCPIVIKANLGLHLRCHRFFMGNSVHWRG